MTAAARPEPDDDPAPDHEGWALLEGLRRRLDDQAALQRKTAGQVGQLAESIAALVEAQRRRSRWLNLNSFVAYVMFTLLCGGAFYFVYSARARELGAARDRAVADRDAAVHRATDLQAQLAAKDAALAAARAQAQAAAAKAAPAPAPAAEDADAWFQLASALDREGQWTAARAVYQRFAATHPTNAHAAFALRRVQSLSRAAPATMHPAPRAPSAVAAPSPSAAPGPAPAPAPAAGAGSAAPTTSAPSTPSPAPASPT